MNSEERTPKKHGPGPSINATEKAKDFSGSILRLMRELKNFRVLIVISLMLAVIGSILSISAPNKLSKLTDEISKGLVVNVNNLKELSTTSLENINEEKMSSLVPNIIQMDLSQKNITRIMLDDNYSDQDKEDFKNVLKEVQETNDIMKLTSINIEILREIFHDSSYDDIALTSDDMIKFLYFINKNYEVGEITNNVGCILFKDIKIDGTNINVEDQVKFINIMSKVDDYENVNKLYKEIDKMPDSIKDVVKPYMNMDKIKKISLFLLILYLCSALFNYIESISMTDVSNKFARKLRSKISKKINLLPLSYFDKNSIGDILSRVTNDIDTIAQSMNQSLASLVSSITLFVGTVIMMFVTNWILAITAILSSLFGFIFMFSILGKSQKYFVDRQVELGKLNGHIEEVYSGLNVVKAYNGEEEANRVFDEYNESVYDANRKSQFLSGLMMPMMNFIGNFGYVAVCIVGALLASKGNITFGVIVAFITYVRLFTSPLAQIAQAMTSLQSTAAASERVFEFLDEATMPIEKNLLEEFDVSKVKGEIEFKNVEFTYAGNDTPTIKDFSAYSKPGQKIAIVGPTGAGKTTMVNLLMKFYDINSGDILIDGISTKKISRDTVHRLFTMVLQDTWLFEGTIRENIVYNRKNITDKQLDDVCKAVGLDHFIKTLPKGLDTDISENDSVSAGQKQLLTIARGMLEDAPFLILDEATSNVDTRTEELVQMAMDKLTVGKTSFIIAHRLSTIKNADLILVMKDGNIIEQGNHEDLMKKKGFYADLYNSQFEL